MLFLSSSGAELTINSSLIQFQLLFKLLFPLFNLLSLDRVRYPLFKLQLKGKEFHALSMFNAVGRHYDFACENSYRSDIIQPMQFDSQEISMKSPLKPFQKINSNRDQKACVLIG